MIIYFLIPILVSIVTDCCFFRIMQIICCKRNKGNCLYCENFLCPRKEFID